MESFKVLDRVYIFTDMKESSCAVINCLMHPQNIMTHLIVCFVYAHLDCNALLRWYRTHVDG